MTAAVRAVGLGKSYRLGRHEAYHTLRDAVVARLRHPFAAPARREMLWALRDVSFEVPRGGVVGLVGRNGAGKTTLLRLLARITRPSEGWAELRGRVASLLEVGTAFHPELTGRENVRMGAAVLGMRRADLVRQFDSIVAFAGVERFLDTPLKRYSTGMQMRLAFAVAAHLEPEVLLVDEVLAVGDLEFQRRCLGRMEESVHAGRTVVLASHQLHQLRRLSTQCLWIDGGRVRAFGATASVLSEYEAAMVNELPAPNDVQTGVMFVSWKILENESAPHIVRHTGPVTVAVDIHVATPIEGGEYGIALYDQERRPLWSISLERLNLPRGYHRLIHRIASLPLRPGAYTWHPGVFDGHRWRTWWIAPDLVIDTPYATYHRIDEYIGLLNVPGSIQLMVGIAKTDVLDGARPAGKGEVSVSS